MHFFVSVPGGVVKQNTPVHQLRWMVPVLVGDVSVHVCTL